MPVSVGLSLREPWVPGLLRGRKDSVDVLEVMIDDLLGLSSERLRTLRRLGRRWPLLAPGVDLGIGDAQGLDPAYVSAVSAACRRLGARWYTEHLCFLRAGGIELSHFAPLDDEPDTLAALARNAALVREQVGRPLLLENPADILGMFSTDPQPGRRLGRAYTSCLHAASAGALLDLTNLLYDARNGGWPVEDFFAELDFDRVVQIHLAGGFERGGLWVDSHSRPVEAQTYALLSEVAGRASNLRAVIVEWDEDLPGLDGALAEVERARAALLKGGAGVVTRRPRWSLADLPFVRSRAPRPDPGGSER